MDRKKLLKDVFEPQADESVLVLMDHPHGQWVDSPAWLEIREMAFEWHATFEILSRESGFKLHGLFSYPATGQMNGDLPLDYAVNGLSLGSVLESTTLACALTKFSASAPLKLRASKQPDFRAASLPGVARRMESTGLAADYKEVARRCAILRAFFDNVEGAAVEFGTGHRCYFDLRFRTPFVDNGYLPRNKEGFRLLNLPSGETGQAPYEGERPGVPSLTEGQIPMECDGEILTLDVRQNKVCGVSGSSPKTVDKWRTYFGIDQAVANIAELAFGCNPKAVVWGNVLEDEKAGFHWAYGRSDFLGGTVKVSDFKDPSMVVHQDIVYARDSKIMIKSAVMKQRTPKGLKETEVISGGEYVCF